MKLEKFIIKCLVKKSTIDLYTPDNHNFILKIGNSYYDVPEKDFKKYQLELNQLKDKY